MIQNIIDQLTLTYAESPLWFWLLGSVLAYGVATNALWLLRTRDWLPAPYRNWLVEAGRFLFFLGVPYLALGGWPRGPYQGLLSLADMGLVGIGGRWPPTRWLEAAGAAIGFGLLACLLLALAWASANRRIPTGMGHYPGRRFRFPPRPWWAIPIEAIYFQVHWAFYRGALSVLLEDRHTGTFLGLGLVYLEWTLNPFWRRGWHQAPQAAAQWLWAALALVTALIYVFTQNLWLCLGVHTALELVFWGIGRKEVDSRPSAAHGFPPARE